MKYPYKYPEIYAELARQNKLKKDLAKAAGFSTVTLSYKQDINSSGDFSGEEMRKISAFLGKPISELFRFSKDTTT